MSRRKKKPAVDSATQTRRLARALLGAPPGGRVIPSKKRKPAKHKKRDFTRESED